VVQIRQQSSSWGPCIVVCDGQTHRMICCVTTQFDAGLGCCPVCGITCPDLREAMRERIETIKAYGGYVEDDLIIMEG
jgi:hypothetical protein